MSETEENQETKKCQILKTATALFARLGYAGVSIRHIAEASGCNVASVSYYFGGKDKLYKECFELIESDELANLGSVLILAKSTSEFRFKLTVFCRSFSDYLIKNAELIRLITCELNSQKLHSHEFIKQIFHPITQPLNQFFEEGVALGCINQKVKISLLTRVLINGLITEVVFLKEEEKIDKFIDELCPVRAPMTQNRS